MAGVGIPKHSETLTGLTASRLKAMTDRSIEWNILAENGLTIEQLNELIKKQDHFDAEIIMMAKIAFDEDVVKASGADEGSEDGAN